MGYATLGHHKYQYTDLRNKKGWKIRKKGCSIQHSEEFCVDNIPIIRIMGASNHHRAIQNRQSILFLGCMVVFGHFLSRAGTFQSLEASLNGNPSLEQSANYQEAPPESPPKSIIKISDPDQATVWTVSEPAKIQWKTENIGNAKSIRFFLAKDDMVVQELGSFENNFLAEGIELAKNVGSGDQYQVVGIELFPDNKFQVAKYATSYFSIRNPQADARKAAALAKRENREQNRGQTKGQKNIASAKKKREDNNDGAKKDKQKGDDASANENRDGVKAATTAAVTDEFQGRKISYIKELSFTNDEVSVSLWDHGRQDGDIVSIYLNGETVVSKHFLTYRKKNVRFKLDATRSNELFLYAHNLGNAPPNTVSIELTDGATSEKIVLNSDLKSCEAVQIKVE
ncbi:MAG: hypothetical protein WA913_03620 [Pricia sp.]